MINLTYDNVYREREPVKTATVANFATVQTEGMRSVERQVEHFDPKQERLWLTQGKRQKYLALSGQQ